MYKLTKLLILCLYFFSGCAEKTTTENKVADKEYEFIFHENTGITTYVVEDNKKIPIQFHKNSDTLKLRLFNSLQWYVLYPNTDTIGSKENNIILHGKLYTTPLKTESGTNSAAQETFYEFELTDWYLKKPFNQLVYNNINPDEYMDKYGLTNDSTDIKIIKRDELNAGDFAKDLNMSAYDLTKFIK